MTYYPPQYQPQSPHPAHFRPGNVLALIGGLLAGASFFMPFLTLLGFNENLLTIATTQSNPPVPNQIIYFFPPLAAMFLAACAVITMLESTAWLNLFTCAAGFGGLAAVGLILLNFSSLASSSTSSFTFTNYLSYGFWVCVGSFLLGLIGGIIDLFR